MHTLQSEDSETSKHDNMIKSANPRSMSIHACPCIMLIHPYFIWQILVSGWLNFKGWSFDWHRKLIFVTDRLVKLILILPGWADSKVYLFSMCIWLPLFIQLGTKVWFFNVHRVMKLVGGANIPWSAIVYLIFIIRCNVQLSIFPRR